MFGTLDNCLIGDYIWQLFDTNLTNKTLAKNI